MKRKRKRKLRERIRHVGGDNKGKMILVENAREFSKSVVEGDAFELLKQSIRDSVG